MNPIAHMAVWSVLATVVVLLAVWRRRAEMQRPAGEAEAGAGAFARVDFWGTLLTAISILYALASAVMLFV